LARLLAPQITALLPASQLVAGSAIAAENGLTPTSASLRVSPAKAEAGMTFKMTASLTPVPDGGSVTFTISTAETGGRSDSARSGRILD